MMKDILKKINKKEKIIIGIFLGVIVITLISVIVKDTHAYYSDKTEISLFNAKIGNFKPVINTFYIKDTNTPKYTNQNINTVYLTWGNNNKNINEMCITEGEVNSCRWQAINTSTQYTFATETEGTKIVKGYIKDKAGNKSIEKSDTIIYDKTAPTIESAIAEDITYNGFNINITANDNKEGVSKTSGIDKYCYGTEDSLEEEKYTCVENSKISINGLQELQSYTYYVYAKDKAGNGSPIDKKTYVFKTTKKTIKDSLQEKGGDTFILKNGMYRFVGTKDQVTNNYICFGTDDTEKCTKTPEDYMYRIIGMTSEDDNKINLPADSLKLIKATPSITSQKWTSDYSQVYCETNGEENGKCKWDGSDIKTYLNTTFLGAVKWETPAYWKGLITSQKWYNVDQQRNMGAIPEPTGSQTEASKIGLMYATDYANAGPYDITNGENNWLFMINGWSTNSTLSGNASYDWTISRSGLNTENGRYGAWMVGANGRLFPSTMTNMWSVRPVFYVSPDITLTGEGTTTNPFIIDS